jgi:hypothetical protein
VIWLLLSVAMLGGVLGTVMCLGAQRTRREVRRRRAQRALVERQTAWAEHRLYDIAQRTFSAMTEEARRAAGYGPWQD